MPLKARRVTPSAAAALVPAPDLAPVLPLVLLLGGSSRDGLLRDDGQSDVFTSGHATVRSVNGPDGLGADAICSVWQAPTPDEHSHGGLPSRGLSCCLVLSSSR